MCICEASRAENIPFYSCHTVTKRQFDQGVTYLDLMEKNVKNLGERTERMTSIITCSHVDLGYDGHVIVKDLNMKIEQGAYVLSSDKMAPVRARLSRRCWVLCASSPGKSSAVFREKASDISHSRREMQKNFPATALEVVLSGFLSRKQRRPFYTEKRKIHCHGAVREA